MGVDTSFATAYTGYYLTMEYDGGGVTFNEYQLYGTLQANIWTRVQMQITASSELVQITIPGTTNAPITGHFDPDTAVDVTVGPETSGATSGWSGYLDNIVVESCAPTSGPFGRRFREVIHFAGCAASSSL